MTTTDHAPARSTTSAYPRSRAAAVSSLESASSGTRPRRPDGRTQAAATRGPAQAPRPASSAPAIAEKPRRRRRRSISHSESASDTGSGEAERAGAERRAIAVRPYDPLRQNGGGHPPRERTTGRLPPRGTGPWCSDRRGGGRSGSQGGGQASASAGTALCASPCAPHVPTPPPLREESTSETACARSRAPSLRRMALTWDLTVSSL